MDRLRQVLARLTPMLFSANLPSDSPHDFKSKADSTKSDYLRYLKFYEDKFGDLAVKSIDREFVLELRDEYSDTPRKADYLVQVISLLCTYALDRPRQFGLAINPALKVKRISGSNEYQPWPDNLIEDFRETAYKELVWIMVAALYTGQRESDVVEMAWPHYDGEGLYVAQNKTSERLWIPAHPDFQEVIERIERRGVVMLTTKTERPWKVDHLRHEIMRDVRKCGFTGYSFHGLRKNAGKNLAEAGATEHQIMAVLGLKTLAMVKKYTRAARQRRLARDGIAKLPRKKSEQFCKTPVTKLQNRLPGPVL